MLSQLRQNMLTQVIGFQRVGQNGNMWALTCSNTLHVFCVALQSTGVKNTITGDSQCPLRKRSTERVEWAQPRS